MTDNSLRPPAGGSASPALAIAQPDPRGRALLSAVVILVASVLIGVAAGLIWGAVAPKVTYQVVTLNPPTAYATNPETSAFIAADGWYCFIALAGGALIGLLGYLIGVRRHGPAPMVAVVIGATGAAFITEWIGHQVSGGPGFDHLLATSKVGAYLHAPISLGAEGALAFWPLAAAIVAGGIELIEVLKARHYLVYSGAAALPQAPPGSPQAPGSPTGPAAAGNGQPLSTAEPGAGQSRYAADPPAGPLNGQVGRAAGPGESGTSQPHFRPEQLEPGQYGGAGRPGQPEPGQYGGAGRPGQPEAGAPGWPDTRDGDAGQVGR